MLLVRGQFVNTDGIEHGLQFFNLESNKQTDFMQVSHILNSRHKRGTKQKHFLALCSDDHGIIRLASLTTTAFRASNTKIKPTGSYFNSLRTEHGLPMDTFDLVKRLPKLVTDQEIIRIAKMHLANNSGMPIGNYHRQTRGEDGANNNDS